MKKKIILSDIIVILIILSLVLINKVNLKEEKITDNTEGMISYRVDGEIVKEQPSKENGYIVNKIECKNGSMLVWDNDNWQVELVDIKSADRCMIDFTKDTNREGYRVTVTSNSPSSLDSLSKTTTNGGIVTIYQKGSTITSVSGCNGVLEDNKVIVRNVAENQTCNIIIKQGTLAEVIIESESNIVERTDFSKIETASKLWKTTDYDESGSFTGTSYYYTGNPDNWVSFAGKLWRIIRVNGNGSVRLLYAGTGGEDGYIGSTQKYNSTYNDSMYVGWKYGSTGTLELNRTNENASNAYTEVLNWYRALGNTYKIYIDTTAIYCNDREVGSGTYSATGDTFYYGTYTRLVTNKTPTLICTNTSDQFMGGFGLMTADEVVLAGGVYNINNESVYYFLNASGGSSIGNHYWWTMSPCQWNRNPYMFYVSGSSGTLGFANAYVHYTNVVIRPVVSLKSSVKVTGGDGTSSNPYTVSL